MESLKKMIERSRIIIIDFHKKIEKENDILKMSRE